MKITRRKLRQLIREALDVHQDKVLAKMGIRI